MDDIGDKAQVRQGLEQAPAKQEEAPLLVALVQPEVYLLVPAKVPLVLKQVDGDRGIGEGGLVDRYGLVEPSQTKRILKRMSFVILLSHTQNLLLVMIPY